ncbi:enhancer of mRNA decapping 4 [Halocaridina rubra]|uniref:Enhancer of mRNA decapping 4 n=1 Tax=Halocaridina rubra TaxID=373956 RepID=A0AAN8XHN9_HALRR
MNVDDRICEEANCYFRVKDIPVVGTLNFGNNSGATGSGRLRETMEASGYKDGALLQALFKNEPGQTICFKGIEEHCSSAIFSSNVNVEMEMTSHTSGSSAITTRNITNYPWEHYYFHGSLVAVHCSGEYIAYAIKAPQKSTGMVRIINRKTGDRGLVKNIRGMVRDLAFAHLHNRVILAFTDQYGTLSIIEVTPAAPEPALNTETLLEVSTDTDKPSDAHRVIWCTYIPDDQGSGDEGDDPAFLLVLTHGPCAEIFKINVILRERQDVHISRKDMNVGYQLIEKHSAPITAAAFSPDGTALATAALDGFVKFFQVYMADDEKSPRCLHQWNPHEGKPLSSLFFLDNHKHHSPEVQFWKYAVTGAANNSELKVWSCESWQCHQTLRFVSGQRNSLHGNTYAFKAAMDPSANFLLLSDIHRRVMYVIALSQDGSCNTGGVLTNSGSQGSPSVKNGSACGSSGIARMVSVTELPVQYPALSLAVTDAAWKSYKRWKHDHAHNIHDDGDDDEGDSADMIEGVVVRCVLINTKSLQEATIRFQPAVPVTATPNTASMNLSVSQDSIRESVRDGLTDLSMTLNSTVSEVGPTSSSDSGGGIESQPPPPPPPDALTSPQSTTQQNPLSTPTPPQPPMNLLTPDSFNSPRKPEECDLPEVGSEEGNLNNKVVTPIPSAYDMPYKDEFDNAVLSLLLRCGSGTLMPGGENDDSNAPNILRSVVAGTSKSPPVTTLPPPPSATPPARGLEDAEDPPLATSEVVGRSSVRAGTSASSSPSLEVQQILHSQNGKNGEFTEDEEDIRPPDADEVELAEDDDIDDEEEEEEPEAHRQTHIHSQPPPPPLPDTQALTQPQQTISQPPPPSSVSQPLSSLPHPPQAVSQSPKAALPHKSPLLPDPPMSQPTPPSVESELQQGKTPLQPVSIFASLKGLPSQLTCAQLEAEIKGGTVSPESSCSANSATQQSTSLQAKRARNFAPVTVKGDTIIRSVSESRVLHMDQTQFNGPLNPG